MKIAFYCQQLSLRGTEVSTYDYADYNEKILGNQSIIVVPPNVCMDAYNRFADRFEVQIKGIKDITGADYVYVQKNGNNDGVISDTIPTLVHAVFRNNEPHGHRYAYISEWLAENQGCFRKDCVPYIVKGLPAVDDLREQFGLKDKIVIGRHGGRETFDLSIAQRVVKRISKEKDNIVFLFMNTDRFCEGTNIIYLDGTSDPYKKAAFINTCDAMLHARSQGETFGLAVAEFSMANKPVITWPGSPEAAHIEMLGGHGIYYCTEDELYEILVNLSNYIKLDDYSELYKAYSPEKVMEQFNKVFLS